MGRKVALLASCAIGVAGFLASSQAWAQAAASDNEIEPIIVTALKRPQDVQDVPLSINVIEKQQVEAFNKSDIRGIQGSVPGLFVQTSPTNQGLYLRGFGSSPANPAFDQSVSLFQDGLYLGRARQFMAPFFDIERVEVLRGPQGALVGKNTAAGAISIVTASPTDTFQGGASANYNFSRDGGEASAFVSGPITPELRARLAVKYKDLDGYLKNVTTGTDDPSTKAVMGRLSVEYEPSDSFNMLSKVEFARTRTDGTHTVYVPQAGPIKLSTTKYGARPFGQPEIDNQNGYNFSTTMNLSLGEMTLTSVTGFSGFDSDTLSGAAALNPENYYVAWYEKFDQQSQELRLLSPTGRKFEYVVGAYFDQSQNGIYQVARYNVFGVINGQASTDFHQKSRTWSLFAQGTWHLTDEFRVLGSARYTWIHKGGHSFRKLEFGRALSGAFGPIGPVDIDEEHFDPSITAQYDVTPHVMVYATFSKGSKAGGFDSANAAARTSTFAFRPEKSQNIEIGEKGSFFGNTLVVNVSAFRLKFDDLQVSAYVPPTGIQTSNAAAATSKGLEATANWRPTGSLRFSASGAYIDAKYGDFPGAPCRAGQPASVCSSTAPVGAANNQANNNNKGLQLPFTPKWSGELQGEFTQPVGGDMTLGVMAAARYRSKIWIDAGYNPIFGRQPAVTKIDVRVELAGPDRKWTAALVGTNLTNKLTGGQAFAWPLESGPGGVPIAGVFVEEGRTISLQGTVKF